MGNNLRVKKILFIKVNHEKHLLNKWVVTCLPEPSPSCSLLRCEKHTDSKAALNISPHKRWQTPLGPLISFVLQLPPALVSTAVITTRQTTKHFVRLQAIADDSLQHREKDVML